MLRLFWAILVFFLSVKANAATYTWIGTTSDWNNGANWNQGGTIPGPDDFVVIGNSGTSNPLLANDVTIARLTISNKILDLGGYVLTSTGLSTLSGGEIRNGRFEFDNTTTNLTFSGTLINVPVRATALNIFLNGSVFNFPARLTIINNSSLTSAGGNVFHDTLTINHEGINNIFLANARPDIFNGVLCVNIRNAYNIYLAYNSAGNQFNNNVVLTNTSSYLSSTSGGTVFFSNAANGSSVLAAGKKILIGPEDFTTGTISIRNFVQSGSDSVTFHLSGERARVILRDNVFNGPVTVIAPLILLHGGRFNADAYFEKTGPYENYGNGGNVFNGKVELRNSYTGDLLGTFATGQVSPDTFNLDLTLTNYSTRQLAVASNSDGNYFGGNIFLKSDTVAFTTSKIFHIGMGTNSAFNFKSGKSILLHNEGFGKGEIRITGGRFLQTDTLVFQLEGNDAYISLLNCDLSCPVYIRASAIRLNNSVFRQKCYFERTHTRGLNSEGGNTFLKSVEIINSGNAGYRWAVSRPDVFHDTLVVRVTGTSTVSLADNSSGNLFKRNVYLQASTGSRIFFGNSGNAQLEFEPGARLIVDSANYNGLLYIKRSVYRDTAQLNLKVGTSGSVSFTSTEFHCPVFCRAAAITITGDYNKFYQKAIFHKTGSAANTWSGITDFFDDFELKHDVGGNIVMGASGSVFNFYKKVDLYRNGSGRIDLAHGHFNFYGDVRYDLNTGGTLGMAQNFSSINFIGSGDQSFVSNKTAININNVTINKPSGKLYSSFSWNFASGGTNVARLNLQKGIIRLDSSFFIRIIDNMTVTGGNAASFVEGIVSKQGDDAFTFPVGKNGKYAPVSMSVPAGNETYDVEYFRQPSDDQRFTPPVSVLSPCEYWNIKKTSSGASTISVSIPWNAATCSPIKPDSMFLALNTGTGWQKIDHTTASGSVSNGNISTPVMTNLGMITYAYSLLPRIVGQISYCRLIKGNDHLQLYKIPTDTLYFSYESRYGSVSGQLDYRLVDYRGTMLLSKNELALTERLGNNSYSIDLGGLSLESNMLYMLEVRNQKNELYRMKFLIDN